MNKFLFFFSFSVAIIFSSYDEKLSPPFIHSVLDRILKNSSYFLTAIDFVIVFFFCRLDFSLIFLHFQPTTISLPSSHFTFTYSLVSFLLLIFWQDAKRAKSEQHTAKLERNEKKNDLVSKWNWDLDFQQIYQHKKIEMMKLSGINKRLFFSCGSSKSS